MEKKCKFSYNEVDDSFVLSCREDNEVVKESYIIDDIIFSLTGRGKIVGLQIRNFSKLLIDSGINESILNDLKEVFLIVAPKENSLFIGIRLISSLNEFKFPLGRIFMPQLLAR